MTDTIPVLSADFTCVKYDDKDQNKVRCALIDEHQNHTSYAWFLDGVLRADMGGKFLMRFGEDGTYEIKLQLTRINLAGTPEEWEEVEEVATCTKTITIGTPAEEGEEGETMPDTTTETTGDPVVITTTENKPVSPEDIAGIFALLEDVAKNIKTIIDALNTIKDPNLRSGLVGFAFGAAAGIAGTLLYTGAIP